MSCYSKCFSVSSRVDASRQDNDMNDVGFVVDGEIISANSYVLSTASPAIKTIFKHEKNLGKIPIQDGAVTARGFTAMIDFIYKEGNYSISNLLNGKEEVSLSDELAVVMELFYVGDIYLINSLVIFCRNILINKLKVTRSNMKSMFDVMRNFAVLDVAYKIVTAQIKAVENTIVDILLFNERPHFGGAYRTWASMDYEIKFKVNQDALLVFDIDKQKTNFPELCCDSEDGVGKYKHLSSHTSQYRCVSWEPENGCKENVEGQKIDGAKFYAQTDVQITLGLTMMCEGFSSHDFGGSYPGLQFPPNGKFATEDLEVEVIEVNGKSYEEALETQEYIPLSVLSFQTLSRVI